MSGLAVLAAQRNGVAEVLEASRGLPLEDQANALIAAGYAKPRTITTFEELDTLPDGAVIVDGEKNAHRALKRTDGTNWWNASLTYIDSTAIALPATLLGVVAND